MLCSVACAACAPHLGAACERGGVHSERHERAKSSTAAQRAQQRRQAQRRRRRKISNVTRRKQAQASTSPATRCSFARLLAAPTQAGCITRLVAVEVEGACSFVEVSTLDRCAKKLRKDTAGDGRRSASEMVSAMEMYRRGGGAMGEVRRSEESEGGGANGRNRGRM